MTVTLGDELLASTQANLRSPEEWANARQFFLGTLTSVMDSLPPLVQEHLRSENLATASEAELSRHRVALWNSISHDSMGGSPEAAAVRAALCAFYPPEAEGPDEHVWYFCMFYVNARLPRESIVSAFHRQWLRHGA